MKIQVMTDPKIVKLTKYNNKVMTECKISFIYNLSYVFVRSP